ncbi:hypothetical protein [Paraclostridium bifermentans]|uniref:hypothetical protein n=1 Tax=Paraclostridium bifermentans TaxID=1490 RepID=UPI00374E4E8D
MAKVKLHFTKGNCELENGLVEFVGGVNGVSESQVQFHILSVIRNKFNIDYWIEPKLEECFTLPSELNHLRYGLCKYIYLKFTPYPENEHKIFTKLTREQIASSSAYNVKNVKLVDNLPDRPRKRLSEGLTDDNWEGEEFVDESIFENEQTSKLNLVDDITKTITTLRNLEGVRLEYYSKLNETSNTKLLERIELLDLKEYQIVEKLKMKILASLNVKDIKDTFEILYKQCKNSLNVISEYNIKDSDLERYKERIEMYSNLVEFCDLFL